MITASERLHKTAGRMDISIFQVAKVCGLPIVQFKTTRKCGVIVDTTFDDVYRDIVVLEDGSEIWATSDMLIYE